MSAFSIGMSCARMEAMRGPSMRTEPPARGRSASRMVPRVKSVRDKRCPLLCPRRVPIMHRTRVSVRFKPPGGPAMDEQVAFIDAIRDAPDEDAHRLVYADWLEDHGQAEQAAFIRAHVTLTHFHECGEDPFDRTGQLNVMALRPAVRDGLLAPFHLLRG